MASRITIYGVPRDPETKRLTREMNVMFVEYDLIDANRDGVRSRLPEWTADPKKVPVIEVMTQDGAGSVYLNNPDEPTLRQCLYSEGILSVTAYWV
jgi:hypothetical protein